MIPTADYIEFREVMSVMHSLLVGFRIKNKIKVYANKISTYYLSECRS